MTDLHIKITDENGMMLQHINVYEDGSDAEYAGEIARELLDAYDGARDVYDDPKGESKSEAPGILPGQAFRVFCEVSGGVTGYRCSYMKRNGEEMIFASKEAAELAAHNAMRQMNGPYAVARFKYTVDAT